MERKICPECGEPINGRSDKKFCSDYCRNSFNNKQNSGSANLVRRVNLVLMKNRRILQQLNPTGKAKVMREKLLASGFSFAYHTHTYTTKKGVIYYFCYEFGYLPIEDNYIFLVWDSKLTEEKNN